LRYKQDSFTQEAKREGEKQEEEEEEQNTPAPVSPSSLPATTPQQKQD
jgi:hypothetical protein